MTKYVKESSMEDFVIEWLITTHFRLDKKKCVHWISFDSFNIHLGKSYGHWLSHTFLIVEVSWTRSFVCIEHLICVVRMPNFLNRLITQYIYQWICNSKSSQRMQVGSCINANLLLTWMFKVQLDIGPRWY